VFFRLPHPLAGDIYPLTANMAMHQTFTMVVQKVKVEKGEGDTCEFEAKTYRVNVRFRFCAVSYAR
jgi:hypothetical protein